ncbi:MAG: hypothetical protein M0Z80_04120 [Treponema sp.]|nr:hypothetical protein [Treponema sp.]
MRSEMLRQFGHFPTESSGQASDFSPWFRTNPELRARSCSGPGHSGAPGAYRKLRAFVQQRIGQVDYLAGEAPSPRRSADYGPALGEAARGCSKLSFHGNAMNHDEAGRPLLAEPPPRACVELPLLLEGRAFTIPRPPTLRRRRPCACPAPCGLASSSKPFRPKIPSPSSPP